MGIWRRSFLRGRRTGCGEAEGGAGVDQCCASRAAIKGRGAIARGPMILARVTRRGDVAGGGAFGGCLGMLAGEQRGQGVYGMADLAEQFRRQVEGFPGVETREQVGAKWRDGGFGDGRDQEMEDFDQQHAHDGLRATDGVGCAEGDFLKGARRWHCGHSIGVRVVVVKNFW